MPRQFRRLNTTLWLCLLAALNLSTISQSVQATELPELGSQDLIAYDQQTEKDLGRAFTSALHSQYPLNYDPEVINYIRQMGHRIASQTGQAREFRFYVINNSAINAFAGPNGTIGIHTGLIQAANSDDEIASVIAHEIAHITQRHLSRRHQLNNSQGNLASFATILAAILIGAYEPTAVVPTIMAGMGLNIEKQLKNSREHEAEADSVGISMLQKAGYNPHAMASFFARLAKENQHNEYTVPEILLSHPVTDSRIAEAENRAQSMYTQAATPKQNSLQLIKHRIATTDSLFNLGAMAKDYDTNPTDASLCYKKSLNSLHNKTGKDITCLKELALKHPEQSLYSNLLLESMLNKQKPTPTEAEFLLEQADFQLALFPNNLASLIRYSDLLLLLNKTQLATELLTKYAKESRYQYLINKKLSEIYAKQNRLGEAYFFKAVSEFNIGNIERTTYLLTQAKKFNQPENKSLTKKITLLSNISNNLLITLKNPL